MRIESSRFSDDTKLETFVLNLESCNKVKPLGWVCKWQTNFNSKKCMVLHIRRISYYISKSNKNFKYKMKYIAGVCLQRKTTTCQLCYLQM